MIELIVVDAGHTLGVCTGPHTIDILDELSPLPREMVAEEERRVLHRVEELTEDHISDLCTVLHIDPERWPRPWPTVGFDVFDYTRAALCELAAIAPVVVLSNASVAGGAPRMSLLADQCDPYLTDIWTSYGMGSRKPDPRLWQRFADVYEVAPGSVVHIGDSWPQDVQGPIRAGCHAVYVETRLPAPDLHSWPDGAGRITVAKNLQHAVADIAALNGLA